MTKKVAVLCWEESRPWVSALRQQGFSVPWVDEPKPDLEKAIAGSEPDVLLVDLTRMPEQAEGIVSVLASRGTLDGVPVVLVQSDASGTNGLTGKVDSISVTTPGEIISAVEKAFAGL